jgi:hypothetical protein
MDESEFMSSLLAKVQRLENRDMKNRVAMKNGFHLHLHLKSPRADRQCILD